MDSRTVLQPIIKVSNSFFVLQNAADLAEEEAEAHRQAELEKEREKELMKIHSKDKRSNKKGGRRSKSGTSPGKITAPESPVPGKYTQIFHLAVACI